MKLKNGGIAYQQHSLIEKQSSRSDCLPLVPYVCELAALFIH